MANATSAGSSELGAASPSRPCLALRLPSHHSDAFVSVGGTSPAWAASPRSAASSPSSPLSFTVARRRRSAVGSPVPALCSAFSDSDADTDTDDEACAAPLGAKEPQRAPSPAGSFSGGSDGAEEDPEDSPVIVEDEFSRGVRKALRHLLIKSRPPTPYPTSHPHPPARPRPRPRGGGLAGRRRPSHPVPPVWRSSSIDFYRMHAQIQPERKGRKGSRPPLSRSHLLPSGRASATKSDAAVEGE